MRKREKNLDEVVLWHLQQTTNRCILFARDSLKNYFCGLCTELLNCKTGSLRLLVSQIRAVNKMNLQSVNSSVVFFIKFSFLVIIAKYLDLLPNAMTAKPTSEEFSQ